MDRQVGRYLDGKIYDALLDYLDRRKDDYNTAREVKVPIKELDVGMMLSRDLRTKTGVLLMPEKEEIRENHLEKINNYCKIYSTDPYAYVLRDL